MLLPPLLTSISGITRKRKESKTVTTISLFFFIVPLFFIWLNDHSVPVQAGRNMLNRDTINPLVFQKYSLMTPSSSVVGTNAGAVVAPTEQLLSYVPAPIISGSSSTGLSVGSSLLPIMSALGGTNLAGAAATLTPGLSDVPVTYK